ncbi:hypothetical protein BDR07DRAFT_551823 [Suillus spraguei]|nr:hypothetical protein BDR07DRAFT_551823 [Suillus spraguei]
MEQAASYIKMLLEALLLLLKPPCSFQKLEPEPSDESEWQKLFKSYRRISSLSFNSVRPSVLQVADLLVLVNQQDLNYDILRTQCYWWSGTVCKSLERLFRGEEEVFDPDNRGHFGPIILIQPLEDDISNICAKFWPAYKKTEASGRSPASTSGRTCTDSGTRPLPAAT